MKSLKKVYPQSVPRSDREDYPSAIDEDDLDASSSIEVLPTTTTTSSSGIRTILYYYNHQGLSSSAEEEEEDCFNVFDDETNLDRCQAVLCDPKESATQYFINDEDLFGRLVLNSAPDDDDDGFDNQHGAGDDDDDDGHGQQEDSDIEAELSEEDNYMLFGSGASGWDSDDTVTDAQFFLHHIRTGREVHHNTEAEEIADVALRETVEDGAKYFDADDLFEQEEETLVYGRDGWYSEDWDL